MTTRCARLGLAVVAAFVCVLLVLAQSARGATRPPDELPAGVAPVEADVSFSSSADGLAANGDVLVRQAMVQRLIARALEGNERLVDARVEHLAAGDVYEISGNLSVTGPDLPVMIQVRLETDGALLTLAFLRISGVGPDAWYEEGVIKGFAYALRSQGVRCDDVVSERVIRIGLNDFMHGAGLLPQAAVLDERATRLSLSRDDAGDLTFQLRSEELGPRIARTPESDVAIRLDADGVRSLLGRLLASDYRVKEVSLSEGVMVVKGDARWRGLEAASSGVTLLAALLGDRRSLRSDAGAGQSWIPLELTLRISGERLLLTTSHEQATAAIGRALGARGVAHRVDRATVTFAWRDLVDGRFGRITAIGVTSRGATAAAHLNASALLASGAR
jgi:hypothetical protein